jgi:hypothetical protein
MADKGFIVLIALRASCQISNSRYIPGGAAVKPLSSSHSSSLPRLALGAAAIGAVAVGAVAVGALAIGALAIGALAIRRLSVDRTELKSLVIGDLSVSRLHAADITVSGSLNLPAGGTGSGNAS